MEIKNKTLVEVISDYIAILVTKQISEYENAIDSILNDIDNPTVKSDIVTRKHLIVSVMNSIKNEIRKEITDETFLPSIAQSIRDREDFEHLETPKVRQKGIGDDVSFV